MRHLKAVGPMEVVVRHMKADGTTNPAGPCTLCTLYSHGGQCQHAVEEEGTVLLLMKMKCGIQQA